MEAYYYLSVETYEDACLIVQWYACRWLIEQVFRLLKKQGFDIESSELEEAGQLESYVYSCYHLS